VRALSARPPRMGADEFIEWAMTLPDGDRYELVGGEVVAMSPERVSHARVKFAACLALRRAIEAAGLGCEALIDGVSVEIDEETVYEPDTLVRCGEPVPGDAVKVTDPVVVVEVVSPSSGRTDKGLKLQDYFRLASVRHYLILDTRRRSVTHHRRDEAGLIQTRVLHGGALELAPPGIAVAVEDLFT
jgi:Uma2 family endonuclease